MRNIVRQGTAIAEADLAYSVHLEISGLQSARPYWYRFRSGDAVSRVGRAATSPQPGSPVDKLRFGFVSARTTKPVIFPRTGILPTKIQISL
jgi:alkaline phosphatase D